MRNESRTIGAEAFIDGRTFNRANIITDGTVIYSYGPHFPMARKIQPGCIAVNTARSTATTGKHQSALRGVLSMNGYKRTDVRWDLDGYDAEVWTRN